MRGILLRNPNIVHNSKYSLWTKKRRRKKTNFVCFCVELIFASKIIDYAVVRSATSSSSSYFFGTRFFLFQLFIHCFNFKWKEKKWCERWRREREIVVYWLFLCTGSTRNFWYFDVSVSMGTGHQLAFMEFISHRIVNIDASTIAEKMYSISAGFVFFLFRVQFACIVLLHLHVKCLFQDEK